jgi:O-methyltransferase
MMLPLAKYANLFVTRGAKHPDDRVDANLFLRSRHWSIATDYVRNGTLSLLGRAISEHNVNGSLAELGVYQGDFALLMNSHFCGRTIHLFDTFEGFDDRDVKHDAGKVLVEEFYNFTDTSAAAVVSRFPDKTKVRIHKGWFPASAKGLEERNFALVSIDADLYQPVLAGLQWFWPRLSPGGYIMVHDYNNSVFKGAKQALYDFLTSTPGTSCCPIPDWGGTAVIGKPLA